MQTRQPRGTPSGGQFRSQRHGEPTSGVPTEDMMIGAQVAVNHQHPLHDTAIAAPPQVRGTPWGDLTTAEQMNYLGGYASGRVASHASIQKSWGITGSKQGALRRWLTMRRHRPEIIRRWLPAGLHERRRYRAMRRAGWGDAPRRGV